MPIIGVMGSHDKEWDEYAKPVGELIAKRGFHLLTGAGPGVMTAVARAFTSVKKRKGLCFGICPIASSGYRGHPLSETEFPNQYVESQMIVPLDSKAEGDAVPYSRNMMNIMTSHAVIILPGEHGTKNEVSLSIMYNKPMIMFGPDKAFAKFPQEPLRADTINHVEQFFDDVFGEQ
jgi:predicted Rossmann-fold nucleotide-binding protein